MFNIVGYIAQLDPFLVRRLKQLTFDCLLGVCLSQEMLNFLLLMLRRYMSNAIIIMLRRLQQ